MNIPRWKEEWDVKMRADVCQKYSDLCRDYQTLEYPDYIADQLDALWDDMTEEEREAAQNLIVEREKEMEF